MEYRVSPRMADVLQHDAPGAPRVGEGLGEVAQVFTHEGDVSGFDDGHVGAHRPMAMPRSAVARGAIVDRHRPWRSKIVGAVERSGFYLRVAGQHARRRSRPVWPVRWRSLSCRRSTSPPDTRRGATPRPTWAASGRSSSRTAIAPISWSWSSTGPRWPWPPAWPRPGRPAGRHRASRAAPAQPAAIAAAGQPAPVTASTSSAGRTGPSVAARIAAPRDVRCAPPTRPPRRAPVRGWRRHGGHLDHCRLVGGQGAGLIQRDGAHRAEGFQRGPAFDQDTELAGRADRGDHGHRHRNRQGTATPLPQRPGPVRSTPTDHPARTRWQRSGRQPP